MAVADAPAHVHSSALAWMDGDDRARHDRQRCGATQASVRVAHWLRRTTLSEVFGPAPESWRFRRTLRGCPRIDDEAWPDARFNVSHTRGVVAVAVRAAGMVGIDVEDTTWEQDIRALAVRQFAPTERLAMTALPEREQRARFFELWTLKEAYLKARECGLSLPLGAFSFGNCEPPLRVRFEGIEDCAERWHFAAFETDGRHAGHIAVERVGRKEPELDTRRVSGPRAQRF